MQDISTDPRQDQDSSLKILAEGLKRIWGTPKPPEILAIERVWASLLLEHAATHQKPQPASSVQTVPAPAPNTEVVVEEPPQPNFIIVPYPLRRRSDP